MIQTIVFFMLSAMVLVPAILVVTLKNVFHAALFLVLSLTGVAGLFAMLGADFLFVVQILLYSGGIVVLLMFVVLLSGSPKDWVIRQVNEQWLLSLVVSSLFVWLLAAIFRYILRMSFRGKPFRPRRTLGFYSCGTWSCLSRRFLWSCWHPWWARFFSRDARKNFKMVGLHAYLVVSALLFAIGLYGILARRNMLILLMSIELIFNAANINFVAFNRFLHPGQVWGQAFTLFVIAIAAAEAVVGLALVLTIYRNFKTVLTENLNILKG
jgi:NADH:ubiquinone oxidoreductase subunit K/NADH:ubiquinone oxidoreductase subunit 6 (subunit J)